MLSIFANKDRMRIGRLLAIGAGCAMAVVAIGCGGGGSTPSTEVISGVVSSSGAPVGAGYEVRFDNSSTHSGTTNGSGDYSISIPTSDITGSDTLYVENASGTVVGTQPLLDENKTAAVTQNIALETAPPLGGEPI